jgi:hypothetical protein
MDFDTKSWGPFTILAVTVILIIVVGGLVDVIIGGMTFEMYLNNILKFVGAALGLGAAIGRGVRLHNQEITVPARPRKRAA